MAHFDTSTIEGFDAMSVEDKLTALLGAEIPDPVDLSGYVKKSVFDKTASDLAAAKKTIADNMTAEEAAKAAKDQAEAEMKQQIADLTRKAVIAENEKTLIAQHYTPELAREVAEAIADGDTARQLAAMAKHDAELEKAIRADLMRGNAKPQGGSPDNEGDDAALELAKALGKKAAERLTARENVLGHYIKK